MLLYCVKVARPPVHVAHLYNNAQNTCHCFAKTWLKMRGSGSSSKQYPGEEIIDSVHKKMQWCDNKLMPARLHSNLLMSRRRHVLLFALCTAVFGYEQYTHTILLPFVSFACGHFFSHVSFLFPPRSCCVRF